MKKWTGVKTVRKVFVGMLAFGACMATCAGTVRTVTAPALALDTRIGLVKVVEDAATLRLSTRWDGAPEGVLTVNGMEAARLGAAEEADHVLDGLAPGEYVCSWTTGASTNLTTFCVRGGSSALPPDGAGVRTATAVAIALDTRTGLVKVVEDAATLRLSTRWDGAPEGVLTVNGTAAARLGAAEEADHVLDGLAPGEYVCSWTTGASTNLATFCVRGGVSVLPPGGTGVRTATVAPITLDTRIGLMKVVEDAATLRLSTRWDGAPEGVLTVNGTAAARLGADAEADHVLAGLAPGEYVCSWTTGASTNLATFCVRGGASALPPDGTGVRTATAAAITLDTRIGLYRVLPVSDRGVASAVCRLSTRWDGAEAGTLTVNGEEVRALGSSEEADHRLDGLAPGEYVCRWTAGDAAYLATFSVRGDGSARPPRTGVEVTVTGHTATYTYDGREKRAGGFDVAISDPLYTVADFVFTGNSNAVRTAVGTTPFGMAASDFANVNPDFADVVFHVVDGSVTVTPGAVVNPFDPDDPSAPPSPGALARADCTAVYDGEGHSISVAPLLGPALAADGATVAYSPDPSRVPFAPESPIFTNAVSTCVWYRVASPNYAPFTTNALLEIRPRPVTLASKSAAKAYDGTPLTAHEVAVGGDGFVDGEGATYAFTGEQTAVGESENTFTYTLNEKTVAGNYEIATVNGTLTVTKASIGGGEGDGDEPGDGDVPDGGLSKFDVAVVYDGAGHTIDTNALAVAFGAAMIGESAVEYAAGGSQFTATVSDAMNCVPPCFTNAGEYVVWYRVTNPNYEDFVHAAKVTITKRSVTLTSGTKLDFVYDGQPHAWPHFIKSGHDFVKGEGIVASNWATVTTVAQGEVANTFDYTAQEGTDLANYAIAVVTGRIAVVKATVGPGGGDEPGDGEIPEGGLSKFDVAFVYDGEGHTIDTNALHAAFDAAMIGESAVEYAAGGSQFTATVSDAMNCVPPCFINAGEYVIWYRVTNPNYEDFVHAAKVTIARRPVTLTSGTKLDFVYDGQPHTCPHFIKSGHDFVEGEGIVASNWATVTTIAQGEVANTFDYAPLDGTDLGNYELTVVTGRIAVVAAPIPVGPSGVVMAVGYTNVYDGAAHGVAVSVAGLLTTSTVQYRANEVDAWVNTSPTFSGVCDTQVWYRVSAPNYAPVIGSVGVRITPRPITLTAPTKSKTYDGTPLTFDAGDVVVGGDGYAPGEAFTLSGFASITEAGRIDAGYTVADGTARMDNYAITRVAGTLAVTPRPVTLTSKSDTKVYDGTSLTAHEVVVGGDGFVDGEGAVYAFTGSQTAVGTSENTFTYTLNGNTRVGNYEITAVNGTLTVTKASIGGGEGGGDEPGDGEIPDGGLSKFDVAVVYDGEGHTVDTNALQAAFGAALIGESAVEYAAGGSQFTATVSDAMNCVPPCFTNAGEYVVWYRVTNPNYEDFVHAAKVTITKRPVTLTSKSAMKVYDGTPLTAHEVAVGGDGFADGEGATYAFTGSQTAVGESENTFTYTLNEKTAAGNYEIATVNGTLTVTRAVIGGEGGGEEPGGGEIPDGGLSKFDATFVYDGEGHTIDTNGIVAAFGTALIGTSDTKVVYGYAAAGAAATGQEQITDWNEMPPIYTNAGEYVVWYRVTNPNYEDFVHAAKVTITKRPVTLTSKSATKVYDGTPLTAHEVTVGGDGFVDGEGAVYAFTGSQTAVGESENTFTYTLNEKTAAGNYAITTVNGTLTVTKANIGGGEGCDEPGDGEIPDGGLSRFDTVAVYDGTGHTVDTNGIVAAFGAVMGGGETRIDYSYAAAGAAATGQEQDTGLGTDAAATGQGPITDCNAVTATIMGPEQVADWREVAPVYTNAGEYVVWYRVTNPNYEDFVHAAKVTIMRRRVTVTSADGTWTYDGMAHSNATVTVSGDGFVSGEGMVCGGFATITNEGACPNSFTHMFNAGTLAGNYEVATVFGTLTVTSAPPCRVIFDALGGRVGSAVAVTQAVRTVYGALPEATRGGYRFAGWCLGVTNGAPEAVAGGDVLALGDHALFAKWICDPDAVPDPEAVYTWEVVDADTARITGLRNPKQRLPRMVLPDRIGGRFVTEVAAGAFANTACGVEELWLPVFCTKIGDRAFLGIPSLWAITFAEARRWEDPPVHAAVAIGRYAFSGATSLTRLVLVEEIASLGDYAFLNTRNLTSVTILGRPTLGRDVFRSCGVDAGGVTVRLDPALADDAVYRESLTSRMSVAAIRTDAVVAGLRITAFELPGTGTARLEVSVERAADWGVVDADTVLVRSGRTLPEMGDAARPVSAVLNGDGTLTLEVAAPDGGGRFFQAVIKDE